MSTSLFAYGTLLVPEIWELVVGAPGRGEDAALPGFEIRRVRGGDFPGIVRADGPETVVTGRVFHDLDRAMIARLDAYEDSFYERIEVEACAPGSGRAIPCQTYVVPDEAAPEILTEETWSLEWFRAEAMEAYLGRMRGGGAR